MVAGGSGSRWLQVGARGVLALLLLAAALLLWARFSGQWLIVDQPPEKGDVIVVLAGGRADLRYYRGLELLRAGYGEVMLVDVEDFLIFGEAEPESAERFIRATAGDVQERVRVCPVEVISTTGETEAVRRCVAPLHPKRLLLVTNDFHSRRALSVFKNRLSEYDWSVALVRDDKLFGTQWWRKRAWANTYAIEWERMIWWLAVDRWSAPTLLRP